MKKVLAIVMTAVMVAAVTFTVGYAVGKANTNQPVAWVDSTGEVYRAK